jgi:hypothetical protein
MSKNSTLSKLFYTVKNVKAMNHNEYLFLVKRRGKAGGTVVSTSSPAPPCNRQFKGTAARVSTIPLILKFALGAQGLRKEKNIFINCIRRILYHNNNDSDISVSRLLVNVDFAPSTLPLTRRK